MVTIYAETVCALKTRQIESDGTIKGGPVYYINAAFKNKFGKFLSAFFTISITTAVGFTGNMVQSNSIVLSYWKNRSLTLNTLGIISTLYTSNGILANGYNDTSNGILANGYNGETTEIVNQGNFSQVAFASVLDAGLHEGFGSQFIAICLFFFAFSTILP